MLRQAWKRNRSAIKNGRVELLLANVNDLPLFECKFDKVFSVNSIMFWTQPIETLSNIRQFMSSNGQIALTIQPYIKGATKETVKQLGNDLVQYLSAVGFIDIELKTKSMKPIDDICALGVNPIG